MRAVQYAAVGAPPRVVEVPDPACPPDGVVVDVGATGLCRSDWHAWRGSEPVPLPHIPGHELAGTIVQVGPQVRRCAVGDRVTTPFVLGCGRCEECRAGASQVCRDQRQPGFTGPGSFAELVALERADHNLVRLPDGLDMVSAASLGCRFATAFRAVTVQGALRSGEWLCVVGCGGVGLSAVMVGHALGARVVAVDTAPQALERAGALGATHTVLATADHGAEQRITDLTGGGAHVSLDAVGGAATAALSIGALRRRGRHVQVGLLVGGESHPALPMDRVIAYELVLAGSHGMAARDYPAMLRLVESGALRPDRLVGAVVGLQGIADALAQMDRMPGHGVIVAVPGRGD